MLTKRFFISWLFSSLIMFSLFYLWHGVFLTDFSRLTYPKEIFLVISTLVYLLIGFATAKAIDINYLNKNFKRKPIVRGAISGAGVGFALFLISTVVGVSFSTGSAIKNLLLDACWQTVEQCIGGIVVGIAHYFVYDPSAIMED